jgi:hypothetical protein
MDLKIDKLKEKRNVFKRLDIMWRGRVYSIKAAISIERAIAGMKKRRWFSFKGLRKGELFKLNPWIEYVASHSELTYLAAINLYDKCINLPIKLTRRQTKRLTTLIMDQGSRGYAGLAIDIGMLAASIKGIKK